MPGFLGSRLGADTQAALPLRVYLRRVVWLCMLPVVLLASVLALDSLRLVRQADERASEQLLHQLAGVVDQKLQGLAGALAALSRSPLLDDQRRLDEFHRAARSIQRSFGGQVVLVGLDGQVLVHTGRPYGQALPSLLQVGGQDAVQRALASGAVAVGDGFVLPAAPQAGPQVAVAVPVGPPGAPRMVLFALLDMARLQQALAEVRLPPGWSAQVRDGTQRALAQAGAWPTAPAGEGVQLLQAATAAPWTVQLRGSAQSRMALVWGAARVLAVAVLGATLIGLLAGTLAARRLARSVDCLANGDPPPPQEIAEIAQARQRLDDARQQRLQAEASLRQRDLRLTGLIDSAMDAVISVDPQHRIVLFNTAAERMFGHAAAAVLGQRLDLLLPARLRPSHDVHIDAFAKTGVTARRMGSLTQVAGLRADGTEFPAEASISQLRLDGEAIFTVILRDVTERVAAEQARAKLEAQLLQAQKMEALGTLAGGIAHDFNNILAAIGGNVELARLEAPAGSRLEHHLAETAKAAQRAADLVRQILTFSRRQPLERVVVDLRGLTQEAVSLLRATVPAGIELITDIAATAPAVSADRTQLHQVLMNLVVNAAQAIGQRQGGRITITVAGETLAAEAVGPGLPPGPYARLSVTDNGPGMDEATRQRIFDPFFTTKAVGEGTGLGLAVVDGIVQRLGGAITVYSEPGRGCAFHVRLPALATGTPAVVAAAPAQPHAGRGQCVLYLDDEPALVQIGQAMLERLGYRVRGFSDVAQALAAFEASPEAFDVLVSDFNMPGASGLEVAAHVLRRRPDLPVALASGLVTDELLMHARALGVREVIYKPHSLHDLAAALQRMKL